MVKKLDGGRASYECPRCSFKMKANDQNCRNGKKTKRRTKHWRNKGETI